MEAGAADAQRRPAGEHPGRRGRAGERDGIAAGISGSMPRMNVLDPNRAPSLFRQHSPPSGPLKVVFRKGLPLQACSPVRMELMPGREYAMCVSPPPAPMGRLDRSPIANLDEALRVALPWCPQRPANTPARQDLGGYLPGSAAHTHFIVLGGYLLASVAHMLSCCWGCRVGSAARARGHVTVAETHSGGAPDNQPARVHGTGRGVS